MKVIDFWKTTKYETVWDVYYRECPTGSIFNNKSQIFKRINIDKNKWAADPLLFSYNGCNYLFFELFDRHSNKGSIALSEIKDGKINKPTIIINEKFHLSFPFVFEHNNSIYMIPETGEIQSLILYKAIDFPLVWKREKVLLNNIHSSDTIVFKSNDKLIVAASIIQKNASYCNNSFYELLPNLKMNYICSSLANDKGQRNAGGIIVYEDLLIRPGQSSENCEYGKYLSFFKIDPTTFNETLYKNIFIDDLRIDSSKKYIGIHTYSSNSTMEFIDLKYKKKNSFFKRLSILFKRAFKHLGGRK